MRAARHVFVVLCLVGCKDPKADPPKSENADLPNGTELVSFPSGSLTLHGLLLRPKGAGPFPAILYNHGSAPGMANHLAFANIGPAFAAHGWVFFMPYRRGQWLSASAGPYIGDEIERARTDAGLKAAADVQLRLLRTDHLEDQLAALAWLRRAAFVQSTRIAAAGNSFGGIEAVLGAERGGYCAAVDASGAAESWGESPALRESMTNAVRNAPAPMRSVGTGARNRVVVALGFDAQLLREVRTQHAVRIRDVAAKNEACRVNTGRSPHVDFG